MKALEDVAAQIDDAKANFFDTLVAEVEKKKDLVIYEQKVAQDHMDAAAVILTHRRRGIIIH